MDSQAGKHTTHCLFCKKQVTYNEDIILVAFCKCGATGKYLRSWKKWIWTKGDSTRRSKPNAGKKPNV